MFLSQIFNSTSEQLLVRPNKNCHFLEKVFKLQVGAALPEYLYLYLYLLNVRKSLKELWPPHETKTSGASVASSGILGTIGFRQDNDADNDKYLLQY
jgi:hypothetical protein